MRLWLYTRWLIWQARQGDARAWRRLMALSRLRVRKRLRGIREDAQLAQSLGIDPTLIYAAHAELLRRELECL